MELNNISLWFAKNDKNEIITIDKLDSEYKGKYYCPLCGSEIIPKAINSKEISPHFAHIDRSKCSGESIIHYWVKNELMKKDDVFEIVTDKSTQHMCKEILFEKSYDTPYGVYKPDITVITYKGEKIFFEVNYTNKKKIEDYYLKWKHLCCIVVEFGINSVYDDGENKIKISNSFNAIYYNGTSFNINKLNNEYISYKKSVISKVPKKHKDKLKSIEWFIDDVYKYNAGALDIYDLTYNFNLLIEDESCEIKEIILNIYKNSKCESAIKDIVNHKDEVCEKISQMCKEELGCVYVYYNKHANERLIADRIFGNNILRIGTDSFYTYMRSCNVEFKEKYFNYGYYYNIEVYDFSKEYFNSFKRSIDEVVSEYVNKTNVCETITSVLRMHNIQNHSVSVKHNSIEIIAGRKSEFNLYYDGTIAYNDINICKTNISNNNILLRDFDFALGYTEVGGNYMFNKNTIDLYEYLVNIYSKYTNKKYDIKINNTKISIHYGHEIATYSYADDTKACDVVDVFSKAIRNYLYFDNGGDN